MVHLAFFEGPCHFKLPSNCIFAKFVIFMSNSKATNCQ